MNTSNITMDSATMFMSNNLNPIQNNPQNNLNNSLQNIQNQNNQLNSNLMNNPNQIPSNNLSLNDSLQNLDDQSPQKRPKLRREPSGNKGNNRVVSPGSSNNLSDFSNINISMNSSMKNMPENSNTNYGLGDVFRNELEHKIQSQNNEIFEKFQFTLNQLNQGNLKEKAKDIKTLCNNENTLRIFSDFFILNRISKEPNNQDKYFELINLMENKDSKELINYQITDTLRYIHKILMSKILEDQKERTVLKNLGNWLGRLTLSRNKPILAKDLDFRDLIQNAYEKGTLNVIIPFISKILEHTVNTKVFNLKNPWLNSVLTILNSIFIKPGLRPNLKFEIEELFKKFGIKEPNKFPTNNFLDSKIPSI